MKINFDPPKYYLEAAVFICGAVVMVMELVGSRFLAPYFGTSLYVWSSIIGVILGSLSVGYWLGGRISVKNARRAVLSHIILISVALILALCLARGSVLSIAELIAGVSDIRLASFFAAAALFALPSVMLGMVSPYAARLKIDKVDDSGQAVGNLYAISTVGSILGTFASGFWLIGTFGSAQINLWLAGLLAIVSMAVDFKDAKFIKIGILAATIVSSICLAMPVFNKGAVIFDSSYGRYVMKDVDVSATTKVRLLGGDKFGAQSAMYIHSGLPSNELVFGYLKYFLLGKHYNPGLRKALMIGGCAYSFPKKFLEVYPDAAIDVVEIDPKLTDIARRYFNLKEDSRMSIFHEDGRVFLNQNKKEYDCVYIDAFNSVSIPYHLVTRQTVQKIHGSLADGGVVLMNVISGARGDRGKLLSAIYATYKSVFPQVYLLRVGKEASPDATANYVLVALKSFEAPKWSSPDAELNSYLETRMELEIGDNGPVLTDDFAPVEKYVLDMVKEK